MKNKKKKIFFLFMAVLIAGIFLSIKLSQKKVPLEITKEISPVIGPIQTFISTTGTVLPKNRLEIKPTVNGRIEKIFVQEGDKVKTGQILAQMSSTERASLLDAAIAQGEEAIKYWENVYKPISLVSPIDGQVIVARTQPGQTVTTNDAVVVLSDHLIVRAQVDETDIGKIKLGQEADISLDAYPETKIKSSVEHIYYESQIINNVTIYNVDLLPVDVPEFFRSGMNASVDFKAEGRESALLLPVDAIHKEKGETFVLLKEEGSKNPVKRLVQLGITDDKNYEVLSGIGKDDLVIIKTKKYALPSGNIGSSPFSPFGQRRKPSQ